jgi:hypothetical protein
MAVDVPPSWMSVGMARRRDCQSFQIDSRVCVPLASRLETQMRLYA